MTSNRIRATSEQLFWDYVSYNNSPQFVIDCEDLEVGDSLEFYAFYGGHVDSNGQQFYRVSCTRKLNEWAAMAARELKNYAPTVKFNKNYECQQPN